MAYYYDSNGDVMEREHRRTECMTFMRNVGWLSKKNGISSKELAEILGKNPTLLWRYLGGKTIPREESFSDIVIRAAKFFDVSGIDLKDPDFVSNYECEKPVETPVEEIVEETNKEDVDDDIVQRITDRIQEKKTMMWNLENEIATLEAALSVLKKEGIC